MVSANGPCRVVEPGATSRTSQSKRQALLAMAGNITSMAAASRARVPGGPTMISGFSRPLTNWLSSSRNGSPPK